MALPDHDMDAERGPSRLDVDHAANLAHRVRIGAGDAGDHHVGLAELEHGRAERVAVLVDHPLDVAV